MNLGTPHVPRVAHKYEISPAIGKTGKHDFTPGTDHLTITYDVTDPPVYGKTVRSGTISYDCGGLAFLYESEGQSWVVEYRKADPENFRGSDGKVDEVKDWD